METIVVVDSEAQDVLLPLKASSKQISLVSVVIEAGIVVVISVGVVEGVVFVWTSNNVVVGIGVHAINNEGGPPRK